MITLETPLGNLQVDQDLREEILDMAKKNSNAKTPMSVMAQIVDEQEHSGEMQYPFSYKCIHDASIGHTNSNIKVLPIMCGNLSTKQECEYGTLLASIISRPNILTVISSDFCHWGSRFHYQPTSDGNSSSSNISQYIKQLDRDGMNLIELQNPGGFATYLKRTRNTICGRHPIAVYLHAINAGGGRNDDTADASRGNTDVDIEFIMYNQSSQVQNMNDSSVSYAAAVARLKK